MLSTDNVELLSEFGDDLEKLLDAFRDERDQLQDASKEITALEKQWKDHECEPCNNECCG